MAGYGGAEHKTTLNKIHSWLFWECGIGGQARNKPFRGKTALSEETLGFRVNIPERDYYVK
jgi:hypothetical protein